LQRRRHLFGATVALRSEVRRFARDDKQERAPIRPNEWTLRRRARALLPPSAGFCPGDESGRAVVRRKDQAVLLHPDAGADPVPSVAQTHHHKKPSRVLARRGFRAKAKVFANAAGGRDTQAETKEIVPDAVAQPFAESNRTSDTNSGGITHAIAQSETEGGDNRA
jgi:hypothetical protein